MKKSILKRIVTVLMVSVMSFTGVFAVYGETLGHLEPVQSGTIEITARPISQEEMLERAEALHIEQQNMNARSLIWGNWIGRAVNPGPAMTDWTRNMRTQQNGQIVVFMEMSDPNFIWLQGTVSVRGSDGTQGSWQIGNFVDRFWELTINTRAGVTYDFTYIIQSVGAGNRVGEFWRIYGRTS